MTKEEKQNFELHTERLVIKPLGIKYFDTVKEYSMDPDNARLMYYLPFESEEETADFLKKCDEMWEDETCNTYECAVLLDGVHIGAVTLYEIENGMEFAWIINKRYWGKGYAIEAARAILDFAVKTLGVRHFIAMCDAENSASYRIMEKLGMKLSKKNSGRKNRLSSPDEERYELIYTYDVETTYDI